MNRKKFCCDNDIYFFMMCIYEIILMIAYFIARGWDDSDFGSIENIKGYFFQFFFLFAPFIIVSFCIKKTTNSDIRIPYVVITLLQYFIISWGFTIISYRYPKYWDVYVYFSGLFLGLMYFCLYSEIVKKWLMTFLN